MKRLIRQSQESDPQAAEILAVIDTFDQLIGEQASLERLARAAARHSRRTVGIDDAWNERRVVASPKGGMEEGDTLAAAVIALATAGRLRGRRSALLRDDEMEAVAASVETAGGRIGTVWLVGGDAERSWTTMDYFIAERLAASVSIDAVRVHTEQVGRRRIDPASVERLLAAPLGTEEAAEAARRAQLPSGRKLVAIAAVERPQGAASLEAVAQTVARAIVRRGLAGQTAVVGRHAAVVAETGSQLDAAFADLAEGAERRGFHINVGVGDPGAITDLHRSWREARETLVLLSVAAAGRHVAHFRELGVLHLLATIPQEELQRFPDLERISSLEARQAAPSDLELLEAYFEAMSLRKTAAALFIHYTTVEYRLKRIEQALGISLKDAGDRLRTQVAIKLVRIQRARSE